MKLEPVISHTLHKQSLLSVAVVLCLSLAPGSIQAAEYQIKPSIRTQISYDDNILLSPDGEEVKTFILQVTPRVQMRASTGKWQADFDVSASVEKVEDDGLDSDNQVVSAQLTRRTEKLMFQIAAINTRSSTRVVELEELGEIGFDIERRDRQFLRPSVTWAFNPTNRLVVGVSGENVHYGGVQFSDYDYYSADIGWTRQVNAKTQFDVTFFGSDYASSPPIDRLNEIAEGCPPIGELRGLGFQDEFNSETVGVRIGGRRQPTSRFSYRGSLGYRDVKTTSEGRCFFFGFMFPFNNTQSSDGFVLDTGFNYRGEKYSADLSISRSVSPIGLGFLTERDDIRLNLSYQYSEKVAADLALVYFNSESIDSGLDFEREGLRVMPSLRWQLTERFRMRGGVRLRSNESLTTGGRRDGTVVFAEFTYSFKPTTFSR